MGPQTCLSFHHPSWILFRSGLCLHEEFLTASRCSGFQWLFPISDGVGRGDCCRYVLFPSKASSHSMVRLANDMANNGKRTRNGMFYSYDDQWRPSGSDVRILLSKMRRSLMLSSQNWRPPWSISRMEMSVTSGFSEGHGLLTTWNQGSSNLLPFSTRSCLSQYSLVYLRLYTSVQEPTFELATSHWTMIILLRKHTSTVWHFGAITLSSISKPTNLSCQLSR
jgi:hypothetical protein